MKKQSHDHDAQGRFAAGNKGGPGNPFAAQVSLLRKAILECLTPENVQQIVYTLMTMALSGNLQAAKFLLTFAIGKTVSPTSTDLPSANDEIRTEPPEPPSPNGEIRVPPALPNGEIRTPPPSPNVEIREQSPSPNGEIRREPSPNGEIRREPSPNGEIRREPSPNGVLSPPMNRKQRRALKKAERKAQRHGKYSPS
jgi:hypothetical protein